MNKSTKPNIVFILADDLGWGDLGCYGQQITRTPNIDRLAKNGTRFTHAYAGGHMCAPSRATLLTGKHQGHSTVKEIWGKDTECPCGRAHMEKDEVTIAHILQQAGYVNGFYGKNHAISTGTQCNFDVGENNDRVKHFGFDEFCYGNGGKNHCPTEIVEDGIKQEVQENQSSQKVYHDDLCCHKSCDFIKRHRNENFFLYFALTAPHTPYTPPDYGEYKDADWDPLSKGYVPMIERLDSHVGSIMETLQEYGLAEDTIVFFSSDNGGVCRDGTPDAAEPYTRQNWLEFHRRMNVNGPLRRGKHYHYEGGIRIPMIVNWPGQIPADRVDNTPWYFGDIFKTMAAIGGAEELVPEGLDDGVSVLPTLLGERQDLPHRSMYWEGHKFFGFYQVVIEGYWKLLRWEKRSSRRHPNGDLAPELPLERYPLVELYHLESDPSERFNLADEYPEKVSELMKIAARSTIQHSRWPLSESAQQMLE